MPIQQAPTSAPSRVPTPCTITPALLKQHSVTPEEYARIEAHLGRVPSLTELGIFSVMWSEHCSYKSSRVHLKRLPTKGTRTSGPGSVVQGPGENAGIIDVGDGWACAFKIESHNHPSYIEPYQGAATGVGGILRDIFTMGARPLAVMDSLRFGPLAPPDLPLGRHPERGPSASSTDVVEGSRKNPPANEAENLSATDASQTSAPIDYAKNHQVANGVVHGVAGYGNCFGVPNLGGETRFEACYSGNPLLNAFALGLVRKDEIFYAAATGVGNPVFYVGAKTGRDGIHGATMASEEFTEGSEQKRPNVQMGDPFLEKLLLEACLEAMKTGAILGIQDMGAAGLTCSTCEMGAKGELGVSIELDLVPQRETGMNSYEIMLSESQERMLLVAQKGREREVIDVFTKWGLDCAEVGVVTSDDVMRVRHGGELVAEIPNKALTDDAPVYNRPVGTWTAPVPKDPPAWVLEELKKPRDYTADLLKLLASPNICDKRYIYEQYDSMVQTNTVQGPGFEAGVIRIKGTGQSTPAAASSRHPERSEGPRETPPATEAQSFSATNPLNSSPADTTAADPTLDPVAVKHSILGKLASFLSASTPEGEATVQTGNEDAANPVVEPTRDHESGANTPHAALFSNPEAPTDQSATKNQLTTENSQLKTRPERGIAMALAGNGRWCYLDPKLGAMHAVAEAARKVACTGATPVAATNCLNFGNPEKPEIMAQLSEAIDGIAEACTTLGTPITGGNVSLYNETRGEGIYPTPVIGVVGILDDVTKAVPNSFQKGGHDVLLIESNWVVRDIGTLAEMRAFGSSAYAQTITGELWGTAPVVDIDIEAALHKLLAELAARGLIHSASDCSDGGLACALARSCLAKNIGAQAAQSGRTEEVLGSYFAEYTSTALITCDPQNTTTILELIDGIEELFCEKIGKTGGDIFGLRHNESPFVTCNLADLRAAYSNTLESQLTAEVITS